MTTKRQYISMNKVLETVAIDPNLLNCKLIEQAESMIDQYLTNFFEPPFCRFLTDELYYTANQINFSDNTLTLLGQSYDDNYFQYTNIELLSGTNKGTILSVTSSTNNVLTFDSNLTIANCHIKISQIGKLPRYCDYNDTVKIKSLPVELIEAIAYQVQFILNNTDENGFFVLNNQGLSSESIGTNYSYTLADAKSGINDISSKISPLSKSLLDSLGLSYQTWI